MDRSRNRWPDVSFQGRPIQPHPVPGGCSNDHPMGQFSPLKLFMGVSPKWMGKIMENPIKNGMIWGENPFFGLTPKWDGIQKGKVKTNSECLSSGDAPWKINMEPTNHPFRKETDLPNPHDYVPSYSSEVFSSTAWMNIAPLPGVFTRKMPPTNLLARCLDAWKVTKHIFPKWWRNFVHGHKNPMDFSSVKRLATKTNPNLAERWLMEIGKIRSGNHHPKMCTLRMDPEKYFSDP